MGIIKFLLEIIFMLAVAGILVIFARTLPRIREEADPETLTLKPHWITEYLERIDERLSMFWEKILRRVKIWLLKLDNVVSKKLHSFKRDSQKENKPTLAPPPAESENKE